MNETKHLLPPPVDGDAQLRLCFLSYQPLSQLVLAVADEFAAEARIEIVDETFDAALAIARQREATGSVDAFVSAGANGAMLRAALATPVATIRVTGYDILVALRQARQTSRRVGIVTYGATIAELDAVKDLLDIEILQYAYRTREEAETRVRALAAQRVPVIVGSSVVVTLSEQLGLRGILAYSLSSVRQGIRDAIELARIARLETGRYERLHGVLHHLKEAVLAVDPQGRIIALNAPMQSVLGRPREQVMGQLLEELAPELSLAETLATGLDERRRVSWIDRREWLVDRTAIREHGRLVGALVTLYDPVAIQEADTVLRSRGKSRNHPSARWRFEDLQGDSPPFARARAAARRFAATDLTVLITGESGTGKELFAQSIHNASERADKPFVAINCAAVPESLLESELFGYEDGAFTGARKGGRRGLLEAAHTGSLFLDEIGDMPALLQTRLLRVLQEREVVRVGGTVPIPVDVRVLAATHQPLERLVRERRFRADLYYRLNILRLVLPPLRERGDDIPTLAYAVLQRCLQRLGSRLNAKTLLEPLAAQLRHYPWEGNLRELENMCERMAVFFSACPDPARIPYEELAFDCPELFLQPPASRTLPATDTPDTATVLQECGGNRQEAARRLGISRTTLWRRLQVSAGTEHAHGD